MFFQISFDINQFLFTKSTRIWIDVTRKIKIKSSIVYKFIVNQIKHYIRIIVIIDINVNEYSLWSNINNNTIFEKLIQNIWKNITKRMNCTREIKNLEINNRSKTNETRIIKLFLKMCIWIQINTYKNNFTIV